VPYQGVKFNHIPGHKTYDIPDGKIYSIPVSNNYAIPCNKTDIYHGIRFALTVSNI
jgi:hypothetical protein